MISTLKTKLENYAPNGSLEDHPQAAVLIICYEAEGELFIVMTERSKNLPSHPGEVAYPGGKKEKNDSSLIETALREASEEIDLDQNKIEIIGEIDTLKSRFGLSVTPFIAIAEEKLNLKANASEVEEIFHIPLSFFKNKPNISEKITNFKGETFKTPVFNFEKYKIWGLTLAFTINFLDLLDIKFDYDL
ncbi:MAG: NUDIX hydrolase [Gammaproteobacteria bacterium]|jgi:8-oxo-dGTP pyrophosphatase MutT (NUDIX family)|tara:strand:- start:148 stop:717 length:570 start_codon:yes stop_codon:yes gene_type:complete